MGKKHMTTMIDNDLQKEVKKLAIDLERPFNNLIEESFRDLLKKYKKKKKPKKQSAQMKERNHAD
jgi:hypothetical protein